MSGLSVKIRGIYATALTERLRAREGVSVVQASPPIRERFDAEFATAPADAVVATTDDRQGVGVTGAVDPVIEGLDVAVDTLAWRDPAPLGAVVDATVTETKGSGAVLDLGERDGFLPFGNTDDHVETGDDIRVQMTDPHPPWDRGRSVVDTTLRAHGELVTLVREGGERTGGTASSHGAPELAELLPAESPEGWRPDWERAADEADLDALGEAFEAAIERAETVDAALADTDAGAVEPIRQVVAGVGTAWVWFGRESRFGLDVDRAAVTTTMPGHHRIKAGGERASSAVDFVEAVCDGGESFPFEAVTRQFGPTEGDRVAIDHGKPAGHCIRLGRGAVVDYDPAGSIEVEREMRSSGTYDGLGVARERGDIATTTFKEGRWWYPTVYRSSEGDLRGTYVNVCTPVEIFPTSVRYVDLHVDVIKRADGTVERVDDDELDAAVADGTIPERLTAKARSVADALEQAL